MFIFLFSNFMLIPPLVLFSVYRFDLYQLRSSMVPINFRNERTVSRAKGDPCGGSLQFEFGVNETVPSDLK